MANRISRLYVPMLSPRDLIPHLAKGEIQWREGYSARSLATRWFEANDLPFKVRSALATSPALANAQLIDAFFERQVELGDGRRPSQTDLLAILSLSSGTAVMAVEGKVEETFGELVDEWLGESNTRLSRLRSLCERLGLDPAGVAGLRYQLFHRTASALIEAERYKASAAILLVHSFSEQLSGLRDFKAFVAALGLSEAVEPGTMLGPIKRSVPLYFGWVADSI